MTPGKDAKVVLGEKSGDKFTATVTQDGVTPAPTPTPSGYYVTGGGDVFGNWAECNTNGKMTESNGISTWPTLTPLLPLSSTLLTTP